MEDKSMSQEDEDKEYFIQAMLVLQLRKSSMISFDISC